MVNQETARFREDEVRDERENANKMHKLRGWNLTYQWLQRLQVCFPIFIIKLYSIHTLEWRKEIHETYKKLSYKRRHHNNWIFLDNEKIYGAEISIEMRRNKGLIRGWKKFCTFKLVVKTKAICCINLLGYEMRFSFFDSRTIISSHYFTIFNPYSRTQIRCSKKLDS